MGLLASAIIGIAPVAVKYFTSRKAKILTQENALIFVGTFLAATIVSSIQSGQILSLQEFGLGRPASRPITGFY